MDEVETTEVDEGTEAETNDILRQRTRIKELETEVKDLRNRTMRDAFQKAGYDPDEGVGKLLFKDYKGDPDSTNITEFAKTEYSLEAPTAVNTQPVTPQGEFEDRLDQVQSASSSVMPEDIMDRIQKAESAGDMDSSVALKAQLIRDQSKE